MSNVSLNNLQPAPGSRTPGRRVGRGGKRGTTSGRGTKGQRARSGGRNKLAYKGMRHILLQTPQRRGHANKHAGKYSCINIGELEQAFESGADVAPKDVFSKGMVRSMDEGIKVLGDGKLTKKLTVKVHAFSASAKAKIEQAGGKVIIIQNAKSKM